MLLALLCCCYVASVSGAGSPPRARARPLSSWTSSELVSFLRASPSALSRYAHTFDGIDGRMLDAMTDAQVAMFLEDDQEAFEVFVQRISQAREDARNDAAADAAANEEEQSHADSAEEDANYIEEDSESSSSGSSKRSTPHRPPVTVQSTESAGVSWATEFSATESAALLTLQQGQQGQGGSRSPFVALDRNPTRCSALLPPAELQLLQQLALQLTRAPTPQNLQDASDEPVEELMNGGCTRLVPRAIEAAATKAPRKLVMVFGSLRPEERHALRGSVRADQRGSLTILSFGANLTAVDSDPLPALELAVDPLRGACAAYHMGLSPEVLFVNGHRWIDQALRFSREGSQASPNDLESFCGCEDWITMWSALPDLAMVGQSADVSAPATLNSLAVRSFGGQRVVVDAPCWGRAAPSAKDDASAASLALSVASASAAATAAGESPLTCNDTLPSSVGPADAPLVAGLLVVEPFRSWDATASRISGALETFGPYIDLLLVVHLTEKSGGMESQAAMHALIREETSGTALHNLRYTKVVSLPFAEEPLSNSFARARNAGLRILAGRGEDAALAAKIGQAVFVLHMDAQERLVHGPALRATLESQRNLCGPSASQLHLTILTNSTAATLEPRVIRRSSLLSPDWVSEADYPAGQDLASYTSTSAERFVNLGMESVQPRVQFLATGPASRSSEVLIESEDAGRLKAESAGASFIARSLVASPVDKLMRDVGLLLAQEAELRAKVAWWFEHRYHSAADGSIQPVPQRWILLLQHTHFALGSRYESNGQVAEAYEYYLQSLEAHMASPRDEGFQVDQAAMAAAAEGLDRVLLFSPSGAAAGAQDDPERMDPWISQRCTALFKLITLHPALPSLDSMEPDSTLRLALERVGTSAESTAKLMGYYRSEFLSRCGASRLEPLYMHLQSLASEQRWLDASMAIASSPLHPLAPSFAQKVGRNTAWWCPLDKSVCQGKMIALIMTIQKQAAK